MAAPPEHTPTDVDLGTFPLTTDHATDTTVRPSWREYRSASRAMRRLSKETRRDLSHLADQGNTHPDPVVAAIAQRWATAAIWAIRVGRILSCLYLAVLTAMGFVAWILADPSLFGLVVVVLLVLLGQAIVETGLHRLATKLLRAVPAIPQSDQDGGQP